MFSIDNKDLVSQTFKLYSQTKPKSSFRSQFSSDQLFEGTLSWISKTSFQKQVQFLGIFTNSAAGLKKFCMTLGNNWNTSFSQLRPQISVWEQSEAEIWTCSTCFSLNHISSNQCTQEHGLFSGPEKLQYEAKAAAEWKRKELSKNPAVEEDSEDEPEFSKTILEEFENENEQVTSQAEPIQKTKPTYLFAFFKEKDEGNRTKVCVIDKVRERVEWFDSYNMKPPIELKSILVHLKEKTQQNWTSYINVQQNKQLVETHNYDEYALWYIFNRFSFKSPEELDGMTVKTQDLITVFRHFFGPR
jgi:hypothetical protein